MKPNVGMLLDVDGVLLDSIPAYQQAWRVWGNEHGVTEDVIWSMAHGRRPVDIIRLSAPQVDHRAALERFQELIQREYARVQPMQGVCELLAQLPVPWAVVTSGSRAVVEQAFDRLHLPLPTTGVYGADVAVGKPDPTCYRLAAHRLGVDTGHCVVVEDAPAGIEAGNAAGMTVIAVTTTHPDSELQQADLVVPSLAAAADALTSFVT